MTYYILYLTLPSLAFLIFSVGLYRVFAEKRSEEFKRNGNFRIREINGRQVAIEADDDLRADVIAATIRTGKPHLASRTADGRTVIQPLESDDEST